MDHHQVQVWLLEGQPAAGDPEGRLSDHLESCETCRQIAAQWLQVQSALEASPMARPQPGFETRWLRRLEADRTRRHHRQAALTTGLAAAGCIASFGLLVAWVLNAPAAAFSSLLTALLSLESQIQVVSDVIRVMSHAFPPYAAVGLVTLATAVGSGMVIAYVGFGALWAASLYRAVLLTRNGGKLQ